MSTLPYLILIVGAITLRRGWSKPWYKSIPGHEVHSTVMNSVPLMNSIAASMIEVLFMVTVETMSFCLQCSSISRRDYFVLRVMFVVVVVVPHFASFAVTGHHLDQSNQLSQLRS